MYISGRERSLKRTFERLDADGDGQLTADEVAAGLSNFGFTCPFSRCVYRTKTQVGDRISAMTSTLSRFVLNPKSLSRCRMGLSQLLHGNISTVSVLSLC